MLMKEMLNRKKRVSKIDFFFFFPNPKFNSLHLSNKYTVLLYFVILLFSRYIGLLLGFKSVLRVDCF